MSSAAADESSKRIRLTSSSTVLPEQRLPQPPADLLELDAGLTHVSEEDPRRRRLLLTLELDRRRVSAPVGFALAGFVAWAALEATEMQLPLAFAGRAARRGVVLRVRENGAERPGLRWAGRTIRAEGRAAEPPPASAVGRGSALPLAGRAARRPSGGMPGSTT